MNGPADVSPQPNRKRSLIWPILGAFLLFLLFWLRGWPAPAMDDLFYNGAAINLAGGGDFSNPLLARQGFPSHYFFVYPPIHPHAVYAWLSVFGISAGSLLAFQNLMFFLISAATILIISRQAAPGILSWIVPWGVAAVFLKFGLRPEAFAVAMTMSGYALLLHCRKAGFVTWLAFFMIFLGTITTPRTSFFGAILALLGALQWLKQSPANASMWLRFSLLPITAGLAAVLVFLVCIHFRVGEFYQTFHLHSTRMNPSAMTLVKRELRQFGVVRWIAIAALALVILIAAILRRVSDANGVAYFLFATFLAAIVTGVFGPGTTWYLVFAVFLLAAVLFQRISRTWSAAFAIAIAMVMVGANGSQFTQEFGVLTGKIDVSPPENRAAILAMQFTPDHTIILDSVTARYVYDYKLPPGVLDFGFAAPFPAFLPLDVKLRPGDIYVISPGKVSVLNDELHASYPLEYWSLFNVKGRSFSKHPTRAFVIPATDCIKLETQNSTAKK
jgi:hypothetical protein